MKVGILGYGNLGRGVECAVKQNDDMELTAVFTRRNPEDVKILTPGVNVYNVKDVEAHKDEIDVLIICGGSATDLPKMTPEYTKYFNVIDSFDTHAKIPEHFANVDKVAKENGHIALISAGWDPGMFSLNRLYANCILPQGNDYTFWGKGVSQGHSDAWRKSRTHNKTETYKRVFCSCRGRCRQREDYRDNQKYAKLLCRLRYNSKLHHRGRVKERPQWNSSWWIRIPYRCDRMEQREQACHRVQLKT